MCSNTGGSTANRPRLRSPADQAPRNWWPVPSGWALARQPAAAPVERRSAKRASVPGHRRATAPRRLPLRERPSVAELPLDRAPARLLSLASALGRDPPLGLARQPLWLPANPRGLERPSDLAHRPWWYRLPERGASMRPGQERRQSKLLEPLLEQEPQSAVAPADWKHPGPQPDTERQSAAEHRPCLCLPSLLDTRKPQEPVRRQLTWLALRPGRDHHLVAVRPHWKPPLPATGSLALAGPAQARLSYLALPLVPEQRREPARHRSKFSQQLSGHAAQPAAGHPVLMLLQLESVQDHPSAAEQRCSKSIRPATGFLQSVEPGRVLWLLQALAPGQKTRKRQGSSRSSLLASDTAAGHLSATACQHWTCRCLALAPERLLAAERHRSPCRCLATGAYRFRGPVNQPRQPSLRSSFRRR